MPRLSFTGRVWHWRTDAAVDDDDLVAALRAARRLDDDAVSIDDTLPEAAVTRGVERLNQAVRDGDTIGIFGDYDCDGVTSVTQLVRWSRRHGCEPVVRLPHRVQDGYGLKPDHVEAFADAGVRILITADTGIGATDALTAAQARGMDVIVLDHHTPPATLPPACALIHPALGTLDGPHPSAAGVVYGFLRALEGNTPWDGWQEDCALAAVGTVADLVPLLGCNRRLVREGIAALEHLPAERPIARLAREAQGKRLTLSATDIAFRIAPRINAAGRMDDPRIALDALLGDDDALALLTTLNTDRQERTRTLLDAALATLASQDDRPVLCAASAEYPHGIIGLIAGRLTEQTGRPSMAVTIDGELCTASLRSPPCYDITAGLRRCDALLTAAGTPLLSLGGHAQAAGCSFPTATLGALHDALCADAALRVPDDALLPSCTIDAAIDPRTITLSLCASLDALQPFGQGNPEPRFLLEQVRLDALRRVGAEGRHLQAVVGGHKLIGFGLGPVAPRCTAPVDLVCRLGIDTWNGVQRTQLFVDDVREAVATPQEVSGRR